MRPDEFCAKYPSVNSITFVYSAQDNTASVVALVNTDRSPLVDILPETFMSPAMQQDFEHLKSHICESLNATRQDVDHQKILDNYHQMKENYNHRTN